ncbi:MAG: alkaline phosphatase family protein [Bacillota bacterium]|nr:alkaline phosphatase family protein [Bacillota bacterium]
MKMIFIFIDGFGIGEDDSSKNPLKSEKARNIQYILNNFSVIPTDACLGVSGLPQSATGQTAIFTGENASKVLGRHLSGQPTVTLKKMISRSNIFSELKKRGLNVTNSNVYREEYLKMMHDPKDRLHRPSVTSVMTYSSGAQFRTTEDYNKGNGIYHDISGDILIKSGYDVELLTPEQAADRLYNISRHYDFTLYEHFMTDLIGHSADIKEAESVVEKLDAFLGSLLKLLNIEEDVLIITSDHGNIEDMSVKTHTYNNVPTIIIGKIPEGIKTQLKSLTDIMPFILEIFDLNKEYID